MSLLSNEGAVLSVWVTMLLALFGFALFYGIMYDVVAVNIIDIGSTMASSTTDQVYYDNLARFRMLFMALPFIAVMGIIMWAFVQSQKREYT